MTAKKERPASWVATSVVSSRWRRPAVDQAIAANPTNSRPRRCWAAASSIAGSVAGSLVPMLPERSEAVVIGGGVMGAAALHYLVELGCPDPVLVERETLASGSTGHCAGGVRTLFSDELNVRIGLESIRRLERFEAELGQQLDLRLWGYLFLLDDARDVSRFESDLALQERFDLDTRLLTPEEARALVPQLATDDLLAGVLCSDGGLPDARPRRPGLRAARGGARCAHRAVVRGGSDHRRGRSGRRRRDHPRD